MQIWCQVSPFAFSSEQPLAVGGNGNAQLQPPGDPEPAGLKQKDPTSTSTTMGSRDHLFKVLVVGDAAVGKTSLVQRYSQDSFRKHYKSTVGGEAAGPRVQSRAGSALGLGWVGLGVPGSKWPSGVRPRRRGGRARLQASLAVPELFPA